MNWSMDVYDRDHARLLTVGERAKWLGDVAEYRRQRIDQMRGEEGK